ncbi:MAG: AAA family ATPase, partial [Bacteroidales bacterium]|nr:AAA family ATPase [Bacteroidales bacterium]
MTAISSRFFVYHLHIFRPNFVYNSHIFRPNICFSDPYFLFLPLAIKFLRQDMERKASKDLINWYHAKTRKPLIVRGARQVGKTWLINDFAQKLGTLFVYINFEDDRPLRDLFEADFDMQRILERISVQKDVDIKPDTLIIFDELQEAIHGITALKYFAEKLPSQPVIAAGSLSGIAMHRGDSFPVGKVDFIDVFPMDFEEFLLATGNHRLVKIISEKKWDSVKNVKEKIIRLLRTYYYVGGMPKCVETFVSTND